VAPAGCQQDKCQKPRERADFPLHHAVPGRVRCNPAQLPASAASGDAARPESDVRMTIRVRPAAELEVEARAIKALPLSRCPEW
jgi:hypothetical protein